ncbi:membrane-associated phospholipid phosphatase [Salibacterium salarium]|uniref:phosphatase PAP2 family protein n=1 Tax=Salibacterium salarium TaxID=284579 RepID=UPI002785BFE3|nr:phosphatase PAP2 family protein [Salibacterium salarium]MDQ0297791.1 membrane-associated phospholipid phosphatase [Salibacterium salarium]
MDLFLFEQINQLAGNWNWLDAMMRFLSSAGYIIVILIIISLLFTKKRSWGFIGVVSLLVSLGINYIVKTAVSRPQPFSTHDVTLLIERSTSPSFPSDQAVIMGVCSVILFFVHRKLGVTAFVLALFVIFSRVFVGHHYPMDVLAGLLVGFVVTACISKVWNRRERRSRFTPSYTRHFP